MLVELTVNWAYTTTPASPFPSRVYWRLKGATSYSLQSVADGTTTTITTITNSQDTLDTPCILEYEGYVIPECFVGTATDCNPYLADGVTVNSACPTTNRSYWTATINATTNQSCRGVEVNCVKSGVYAIHAADQDALFTEVWANPGPTVSATGGAPGSGFGAVPAPGAYNSTTGRMEKDCWVITQGNNYPSAPTVTLSRSNGGVDISMIVTMACNDFTYTDCKSGAQTSGQVLLGESKTVCMPFDDYSTFVPSAVNSIFEKSLGGCCSGNGQRFTFLFTSPDPVAYPSVVFSYLTSSPGGGAQTEAMLNHGVPYTPTNCIGLGSISAYTPDTVIACKTDTQTNIWLFNNHVLITPGAVC